jgi:uncharacterized membrane protein YeaQ/YmgE (transglycosylase-associated protein family)
MRRIIYWIVVTVLAAAVIACLFVVAANGWNSRGVLGVIGALVAAAVLFSYAGSTRRNGHPIAR